MFVLISSPSSRDVKETTSVVENQLPRFVICASFDLWLLFGGEGMHFFGIE